MRLNATCVCSVRGAPETDTADWNLWDWLDDSSLQVMFRQIDEAAELSLEEAMQMEYRVGVRLLTSPGEGPVWRVVHVADVCVPQTPPPLPVRFCLGDGGER